MFHYKLILKIHLRVDWMIFIYRSNKSLKKSIMNKDQVLGILRHVLTFMGGFLVVRGIADESLVQELIGGLSTLVGAIWSIVAKKK